MFVSFIQIGFILTIFVFSSLWIFCGQYRSKSDLILLRMEPYVELYFFLFQNKNMVLFRLQKNNDDFSRVEKEK